MTSIILSKSEVFSANLSWQPSDLKLYTTQTDDFTALMFSTISFMIVILGILVHKAVFKLLKKLPDRPINMLIYTAMVSALAKNRLENVLKAAKLVREGGHLFLYIL